MTIDDGVILVPEYGNANPCDTGFIFANRHDSGVESNFAPRHTPGIGDIFINQIKFPVVTIQMT